MENIALKLTCEESEDSSVHTQERAVEVRLIKSAEQDIYIFFRGDLFAQYQKRDNYTRNVIIAQLFLCHHVAQQILSDVFQLMLTAEQNCS